jgi:hypothetical protein
VLSHQKIFARFIEIHTGNQERGTGLPGWQYRKAHAPKHKGMLAVDEKRLSEFAVPVLISNYFKSRNLTS